LKCGDHPGKVPAQVAAAKAGSDGLVTNFPVWCGSSPPVAVKVGGASAGPVDTATAEKQLLDLVNSDRSSAGVKPLNALPALASIARQIAQSRAEGKGV